MQVALDYGARSSGANLGNLLPRLTRPNKLPSTDTATTPNGTHWAIKPKYSQEADFNDGDAQCERERPVPAPRHSRTQDHLLIKLESPESEENASQNADANTRKQSADLEDIEFDPLKQKQKRLPVNEDIFLSSNSSSDQTPHNHVHKTEVQQQVESPVSPQPVPKPRVHHRQSVSRKDAFHRENRPESFVRKSPVPQPMSEARTAFMKSQPTKPTLHVTNSTLDQFDPLVTGQLAVDTPKLNRSVSRDSPTQKVHQEENLLKEWNMDFSKVKAAGAPPVPPKPAAHLRHSVYIANPSQLTQLYGGQLGYSPSGQGSQIHSPNKYATLSTSMPSVHFQYSQQKFSQPRYVASGSPHFPNAQPGGAPKSPYMPPAPGHVQQLAAAISGGSGGQPSQSVGSQDPFSDVLSLTSKQPAVTSSVTSSVNSTTPTPPARSHRKRAGWEHFNE